MAPTVASHKIPTDMIVSNTCILNGDSAAIMMRQYHQELVGAILSRMLLLPPCRLIDGPCDHCRHLAAGWQYEGCLHCGLLLQPFNQFVVP